MLLHTYHHSQMEGLLRLVHEIGRPVDPAAIVEELPDHLKAIGFDPENPPIPGRLPDYETTRQKLAYGLGPR